MKAILLSIWAFITSVTIGASNISVSNEENRGIVDTTITEDIQISNITPSKLNSYVPTTPVTTNWWSYPSIIYEATRSGNDLLVLVNKEYKLPKDYAPSDLVKASLAGITNGSSYYVRNILINDLKTMVTDAKTNGIGLRIVSGYRSYTTQESTYSYWLSVNGGNVDATDKISARPGHSQHQLGTAIDFSSDEIADGSFSLFKDTLASKWLAANAWKYGFVISYPYGYESVTGYSYESWHYRYIGKTYATEMHSKGVILELYLQGKN